MGVDAYEKVEAHRLSTLKSTGGSLLATTFILVTVWAFQTAYRAHDDLLHRKFVGNRFRDAAINVTRHSLDGTRFVLVTYTTNDMQQFISNMRCSLKQNSGDSQLLVVSGDERAHAYASALGVMSVSYKGGQFRAIRTLLKAGFNVLYAAPETFWCGEVNVKRTAEMMLQRGINDGVDVHGGVYYVAANERSVRFFDALIATGEQDPTKAFNSLLKCRDDGCRTWDGHIGMSHLNDEQYALDCSRWQGVPLNKLTPTAIQRKCASKQFKALHFGCVEGGAIAKRREMNKRGMWLWDDDALTCKKQ